MAARDDTDALLAAALAAKALQTARQALLRAPVPGPKGDEGPEGSPGRDGAAGPPGDDGADGRDGAEGQPGKDGTPGQIGRNGADGAPGEPGEAGPQGEPGRDGVDALEGRDGKDGRRGIDGKDGRDAMTLAPARVTFERDARQRTSRMLVLPVGGGIGLEVMPVRDERSGLMVAADIAVFAPATGR